MAVRLVDKYLSEFVKPDELALAKEKLVSADAKLKERKGGNDFKGWYDLPGNFGRAELAGIEKAAAEIAGNCEVFVVAGVGGSYLGGCAAVEFLRSRYYNVLKKDRPDIYFVGNSFSGDDLDEVLSLCDGKEIAVNFISKSGTTAESAVAFRFLRQLLLRKYKGEELRRRVFITAGGGEGALKDFAEREGFRRFVIPDDIGGRFSVLTPVGLLPAAVCGADIGAIIQGAADMKRLLEAQGLENDAYRYAALRNIFYNQGKTVEVFGSYEPSVRMLGEWWKQLFGESEGKDGKGIFPASVTLTTDLHSMGQYIQDGKRMLFETVLRRKEPRKEELRVPAPDADVDGIGFLAGERLSRINDRAFAGTLLAHTAGGVPNIVVEYDRRDERDFGSLVYFFFVACAVSGYMLGVNPFDQPGVEAYKRNTYALLGKPGSEKLREELTRKIAALT